MAGLYLHIPFCKKLCGYCDFFKSVSMKYAPLLPGAMECEMERQRGFFGNAELRTVYFGGGTPTVYPPQTFQRLLDKADELWGLDAVEEITVEANPDDLTEEYLHSLAQTRVDRVSIGVQSFVDRDLRFMNRRHDAARAVECVKAAQREGFHNITIDLIYGLPEMSMAEWRDNIRRALELGVQHISAYHLSIEDGTMFSRRGVGTVPEERSEEEYLLLHEMLAKAGYEHYEISNFALPGFRSKHNSAYWTGVEYLGIGPSAHSFDGHMRRWAVRSVGGYMEGAADGDIYEQERLDERDLYDECVMLGLRRKEGIDKRIVKARFGEQKLHRLTAAARRFVAEGVLEETEDSLRFVPEKWLVSDGVISELFDG